MSVSRRSFADALRQADRGYADHGVPAVVSRRMRDRLAGNLPSRSRKARTPLILVGVAALAGIVFFFGTRDSRESRAVLASGFRIENPSPDLRFEASGENLRIESGGCELVHDVAGMRLRTSGLVQLTSSAEDIRVERGTVHFSVSRRAPEEAPARVLVSHGAIEVLGTQFTVMQREQDGEVFLYEGAIQFVPTEGAAQNLRVGESISWPVVAKQIVIPDPPLVEESSPARGTTQRMHPEPRTPPITLEEAPTAATEEDVIAALAKLRSRRQWSEAAALLRSALGDPGTRNSIREQLSYELGAILSNQLSDERAACEHWDQHNRRYANGRYRAEVESAQHRLRCDDEL